MTTHTPLGGHGHPLLGNQRVLLRVLNSVKIGWWLGFAPREELKLSSLRGEGSCFPQPPCAALSLSSPLTRTPHEHFLSWLGRLEAEALWSPQLPLLSSPREDLKWNLAFSPSPAPNAVACPLLGELSSWGAHPQGPTATLILPLIIYRPQNFLGDGSYLCSWNLKCLVMRMWD